MLRLSEVKVKISKSPSLQLGKLWAEDDSSYRYCIRSGPKNTVCVFEEDGTLSTDEDAQLDAYLESESEYD